MKWTKKDRFPADRVGSIKDEISEKVKGVGEHFEEFISEGGKKSDRESKQGTDDGIIERHHTLENETMSAGKARHESEETKSIMIDQETVSTPISLNEKIANQAASSTGTSDYTPLEIGSLPIEKKSYYSHFFALTPLLVTNRGCIKVGSKNFDYIQIIQRE
jgi:hypothetical protein